MNSPTAQTVLMGLVAAGVSLIAAWFYPWPETVTRSDLVGKPLFESFEAKDVRTIAVTEYDADRNGLKQISLRRSGEFWVIPNRQNFVADNPTQISLAINSVNTNVLEQRSNDLQDHVEYGVIDPMEFESTLSRSSLGKKIVLLDRNNRELASLIVGGSPRDDANVGQTRRFVRIAGKPAVYVVELPFEALTTDFSRWVNSNLFELTDPSAIESVSIRNYRTSEEQLTSDQPTKAWRYELILDAKNQNRSLAVPTDQGDKLTEIELNNDHLNSIRLIIGQLENVVFTDARKKDKAVADLLKNPQAEMGKNLNRLNEAGFHVVGRTPEQNDGLQFQSVSGEMTVKSTDGIAMTLLVGKLVEAQAGDMADLNRLVMLYASFDPASFPAPTKPEGEDEAAERAYLRQVAERDAKMKQSLKRVQLLNEKHADWFYVVSEQVLNRLIPDLRIETPTIAPAEPAQGEPPETSDPTPGAETPVETSPGVSDDSATAGAESVEAEEPDTATYQD